MKFVSLDQWLNEEALRAEVSNSGKNDEDAKYGCVMMDANIPDWEDYHLAGIDEEDIHTKPYDDSYGLETQPHITIVYGIHEDEIDEETISNVIEENLEPLTVLIEEVDIFEGEEYDVVKYNVPVSEQLQKYRDLFLKFPNTQKFPKYNPHMTIAYVKPGKGKKYKRKLREPFEVTFTRGVYSWHDDPENPEETRRKVKNLEGDKTISENVQFRRGLDPKKALDIGKDRILPHNELISRGTKKIFPEVFQWLKDSGALEKYSLSEDDVRNEIEEFLETIVEMWGLERLSQIEVGVFKEYWKDVHAGESINEWKGPKDNNAIEEGCNCRGVGPKKKLPANPRSSSDEDDRALQKIKALLARRTGIGKILKK
jgi:2'-5' RNA ligase